MQKFMVEAMRVMLLRLFVLPAHCLLLQIFSQYLSRHLANVEALFVWQTQPTKKRYLLLATS